MTAPVDGLELTAPDTGGRVSGNLTCQFLLRDFPELNPNNPNTLSVRMGSNPAAMLQNLGEKPGRNERCHCGSGLKFKRCHGK